MPGERERRLEGLLRRHVLALKAVSDINATFPKMSVGGIILAAARELIEETEAELGKAGE